MYIIKADDYVVHDGSINDRDYVVTSGTLNLEFNRAGTLSFTVPPNNNAYKIGALRKLSTIIRVYYKKDNLIWKGRILDNSKDFYGNATFNCEGWLGVLNDSIIRPNGTESSGSGSGGSYGSGATEKAITWMINLANDSSHGYDQYNRWGPDYDCSSSVISAWEQAGVPVKTNGASYTGDMYDVFKSCGFKDVTADVNMATGEGLVRGDVLLNIQRHTAMYCGDGREVEASINENGSATGGIPGDQTGNEILVRDYRNFPWDKILRYSGGSSGDEDPSPSQTPSAIGTVRTYGLSDDQIRGIANVFHSEEGGIEAGIRACASHLCNRFEKWPMGGLNDPYNYLIYSGHWGGASFNIGRMNGSHGVASEANVQAVKEVINGGKRTLPLYIDEYDMLGDIVSATNNGAAINKDDRSAYVRGVTVVRSVYATDPNDKWIFWGFPDGPGGSCDAFGYINKPAGATDFIPAESGTTGGGGSSDETLDLITIAPGEYFVQLIQNHNEMVGPTKALNNMMPTGIFVNPVTFPAANYESTLDYIQTNFIGNELIGGRMWVDENNIYYYPDGTEDTSLQPFEFGSNILDLTENYDASEVFTVIIPTGKDGLKLTPTYPVDYIRNETGIAMYSIIVRHADFPEIEDPMVLYSAAKQVLDQNVEATFNIEVSAFDLGLVNSNAGDIRIGTFVELRSKPHGFLNDKKYLCTASEIDITNPANTKYTLGINLDTLTTRQLSLIRSVTSSSGYTSELPAFNMEYMIHGDRIEVKDMVFRRTGNNVQLLFKFEFKKTISNQSVDGPTVMTFRTNYAPSIEMRFSTGYNENTKKSYVVAITTDGKIQILNGSDIAIGNILTGNANWTY